MNGLRFLGGKVWDWNFPLKALDIVRFSLFCLVVSPKIHILKVGLGLCFPDYRWYVETIFLTRIRVRFGSKTPELLS